MIGANVMPIVKISERGQMVIPLAFRRKMDLQKGSRLALDFSERDRTITLRPLTGSGQGSLRGFLKGTEVMEVRRAERQREMTKDAKRTGR
jgi:AbrB family looped-hinge helix DNA binding protein